MAAGIVCEFNPFHNGHKYLLEKARELTGAPVICAMSGSFVQRGELACAPKQVRAGWAADNGADIVFETPFPFSCAGAESFARGAVNILNKSGLCDTLVFGVEDEKLSASEFFDTAHILLDQKTEKGIADVLEKNKSLGYARARSLFIREKYGEKTASLLTLPNCLLGVEYAKAIVFLGAKMNILTVARRGAGHDGAPSGDFSSASWLRENFSADAAGFCPDGVAEYISGNGFTLSDKDRLYAALSAKLLYSSTEDISNIAEIPWEYGAKMKNAAEKCKSYDEFFDSLKAKHIPDAKLRRMILFLLCDVKKDDLSVLPDAAFLLSYSDASASLLRRIKKENNNFTVLSKISDIKKLCDTQKKLFEKGLRAQKLFERLCTSGKISELGIEK